VLALLPAAALAQQQHDIERLFYYYDNPGAWESFQSNIDQISIIAPSRYNIDEDGIVWGDVDARIIRLAREGAVASLLELCRRNDYLGIQVDFENLHVNDRDAFTQFYREVAAALHAEGYLISAAIVHQPDELAGATSTRNGCSRPGAPATTWPRWARSGTSSPS